MSTVAAIKFLKDHADAMLLGVAIFIALFTAYKFGVGTERAAWESLQAAAIAKARATEHAGASIANTAERDALARANQQREQADAELTQLRAELARHKTLLDGCRVPGRVVRMLDGGPAGVPATAGAAAAAGGAAEGLAGNARRSSGLASAATLTPGPSPEGRGEITGADAPDHTDGDNALVALPSVPVAAVIENAAWNRLNVCEANGAQVRELQRFYSALRERFNKP